MQNRSFGFTSIAIALLIFFTSLSASARELQISLLGDQALDQTSLVPAAESIEAFTAPLDGKVTLTRFCSDTCLACRGRTLGAEVFQTRQRGCIDHQPGIELPRGEIVQCTNRCPTMQAALFVGTLRP